MLGSRYKYRVWGIASLIGLGSILIAHKSSGPILSSPFWNKGGLGRAGTINISIYQP